MPATIHIDGLVDDLHYSEEICNSSQRVELTKYSIPLSVHT